MRVLIIGAGSVGIAVGATLKQSGVGVDFITKGATKTAIEQRGIARNGLFGDINILAGEVGTFSNYKDLESDAYDYIIVAAKTPANDEISIGLGNRKDILREGGKLVFMQNGIGYENPYLVYFDEDEVYHCRVITGFKRMVPNVSTVTVHQAPFKFGSVYGYESEAVRPLADALTKSGIPSEVDDDVSKALWAKLIYNTTLNPLGAILNMSYGELAENSYAHAIMDTLIEETFAIMDACGASVYWNNADEYREEFYEKLVPDTYDHRSSTLQDIEKKKKTEIDYLTGNLLTLASQNDVSAPVHSMVYWLVKAMEEKFED